MANVVDYEEFQAFREEVRREREENQFYREVVSQLLLLSRKQAASVLGVSDATMHRIIKAKRIPYHPEGNRQLFYIQDLINYRTEHKIGLAATQRRVFDAIAQQKTDSVTTKSV